MRKSIIKSIAFALAAVTILCLSNINVYAIEKPIYNTENVLEVSGVTAEELEAVLKHNLIPLANTYVQAEKETGVNAIFIASISALESGWGRSSMALNMNNLFGYGKKVFNSKEESIMHVAWALKNNYLTENGKYYNGVSVVDVEKYYCPTPVGEWSTLVSKIMTNLGEQINTNRENTKKEIEEQKNKEHEKQKEIIEEVVTQTVAVESRRLQNERVHQKMDLLEQERVLVADNIRNIKNIFDKLIDIANNINIVE